MASCPISRSCSVEDEKKLTSPRLNSRNVLASSSRPSPAGSSGASTPTRDTLTSIARAFGEPDDDWVRIAGRDTASDLPEIIRSRYARGWTACHSGI